MRAIRRPHEAAATQRRVRIEQKRCGNFKACCSEANTRGFDPVGACWSMYLDALERHCKVSVSLHAGYQMIQVTICVLEGSTLARGVTFEYECRNVRGYQGRT